MTHKRRDSHNFVDSMRGFTLVEVLVTIVVIIILATITTLALVAQQSQSRDETRNSRATLIAEALENYYEKNGEYPSVGSLVGQSLSTVKQKLSIADEAALVFPQAQNSEQVSIVSQSTGPSPTQVVYNAAAKGSANVDCQDTDPAGYCDGYQLVYEKESDGTTVTIDSRRNPFVADAPACTGDCISAPMGTPEVNGEVLDPGALTTVRFTASGATCSEGSVEYQIRYNTTSDSESDMPAWPEEWLPGDIRDVSRGSDTTFYSQARAHCVVGADASAAVVSGIDTLNIDETPPEGEAPAAPLVSASATSSSTIQLSWSNVSGATSYTVTGAGSASDCTSSPCTVFNLNPSTYYSFNVYAHNSYGSSGPGTAGDTTFSSTPSCTNPSTPSGLSTSSVGTSSLYLSWNASSGTSPITYYVYYGTSSSAGSYYSSTTSTSMYISGLSPGTTYYFKISASNSCGSTGYSSTVNRTTSDPPPTCTPPSTPSYISASPTSTSAISVSTGSSSGTSPISYSLSYGPNGSYGTSTSVSPNSSISRSGLGVYTNYSFRLTASNSCGSNSTTTTATTYSNINISPGDTNGFGNTYASWSGSNLPASTTYTLSVTRAPNCTTTARNCGSAGNRTIDINQCYGSNPSFTISSGYGGTGSATGSWPPQPTVSGVTAQNRYPNGIRVAWSVGNQATYSQMRYKKQGTTGGYSSAGDSVTTPTLVNPLTSNSNFIFRVYASNCRYKHCDTNNNNCNGIPYSQSSVMERTFSTTN